MLSFLNPLPHLSKYSGPYKVGSTEFEIPVSEIQSFSQVPDPKVSTIKFRLFYPTTSSAKSKKSISWLPTPQKQWNQAYAQFMGISESRASWLSSLPSLLNHVTIPAIQNAPLLETPNLESYPTVVFSHGLGGNYNTYSSFVGSLASCGVICVVPEHRDGSSPISFVKSSRDKIETTVAYQKLSHSPTMEVLNARNAMLRVRLWELELVYSTISQMNRGKHFTNYADTVSEAESQPSLRGAFNLKPGQVTWAGHSFGAATMMQFVKSVYYHQSTPKVPQTPIDREGWNRTPLYIAANDSELVQQITSSSPVALLDLWTMPLRGEATRWLWEKPMPCYERQSADSKTNVISIMSAEFYKWSELLLRIRAALSPAPADALETLRQTEQQNASTDKTSSNPPTDLASRLPTSKAPTPAESSLDQPAFPDLNPVSSISQSDDGDLPADPPSDPSTRTPSPSPSSPQSHIISSSTSSLIPTPVAPHLYRIPHSAHLSQSDFGPLFPNLTRYLMKALDPEKTMELNVRAVLAMMRGAGLPVRSLVADDTKTHVDRILEEGGIREEKGGDRWVRVPLA